MTFAAGLATQAFWILRLRLSYRSLLSALISCLGIALLLRANGLWIHPLIASLSISSKFFLQIHRRHFFNPSALGIVVALLVLPNTWLSPGQWGSAVSTGVWFVAIGGLIATRARRIDISWLFLIFYLGGLFLRNLYLGYEIEIFWHSASSGSLLLFAFFMISDPKTSPDHFVAKAMQALVVALVSLFLHYYFYKTNGYIYALVGTSLLVPFLNQWMRAKPFEWRRHENSQSHHRPLVSYN